MICERCKNNVSDDAAFCPYCGNSLKGQLSPEPFRKDAPAAPEQQAQWSTVNKFVPPLIPGDTSPDKYKQQPEQTRRQMSIDPEPPKKKSKGMLIAVIVLAALLAAAAVTIIILLANSGSGSGNTPGSSDSSVVSAVSGTESSHGASQASPDESSDGTSLTSPDESSDGSSRTSSDDASAPSDAGAWSFRTDTGTVSSAKWIYYMYESVLDAFSMLQEESYDDNADITTIDWSSKQIEGRPAFDWITDKAKEKAIYSLTMEKLAKDAGVTVDDDALGSSRESFSYFYENYYKTVFDALGISENDYYDVLTRSSALYSRLFDKMYGKGGEKEVSDDEAKKYFLDNYAAFFCMNCDTKWDTDETGEARELDSAAAKKIRESFDKALEMLNSGKSFGEVTAWCKGELSDYLVDAYYEADTKENYAMYGTELEKSVLDAEEGKAYLKEIEGVIYLICRLDVSTRTDRIDYTDSAVYDEDDINVTKHDIVYYMKNNEFSDYIRSEQSKLVYEQNDACVNDTDPQKIIDVVKSIPVS